MIKSIKVNNFRCLKDIFIPFEDDVSVIAGENDCGKSSLIDAIKIVFDDGKIGLDDFYHGTNEITFEIEIEDRSIIVKFVKDDDNNISDPEIKIKLNRDLINRIDAEIDSDRLNTLEDPDKLKILKVFGTDLGVSFRSDIGFDTLKERIKTKIEELNEMEDDNLIIDGSVPLELLYFLDGKDFEDVKKFFIERFFKLKKSEIWSEETPQGISIEDTIRSNLDEYSDKLVTDIENEGITDKLRQFLPELDNINIKPIFEPKAIPLGLKVQLLERDGNEINFDKKGDGTKRKITMALLEYGKEINSDLNPVYIFDEPDTHLHVRSQIDLLKILRSFNQDDAQIILTTHSPFILNAVDPRQVKLLVHDEETKFIPINTEAKVERSLQALGIENVNLFFSRKILIVEGDTEEKFVPIVQRRFYRVNLHNNLVKLINRRGITDVPRFAEVLSDFVKPIDIYLLIDNDGDELTEELIDKLTIPDGNIAKIGNKEFEDSFTPEVIYHSWKNFVEDMGKHVGSFWTIENIKNLKISCLNEDGRKFSNELKTLNAGCGVKLKKQALGQALAENVELTDLDSKIRDLLVQIQ